MKKKERTFLRPQKNRNEKRNEIISIFPFTYLYLCICDISIYLR